MHIYRHFGAKKCHSMEDMFKTYHDVVSLAVAHLAVWNGRLCTTANNFHQEPIMHSLIHLQCIIAYLQLQVVVDRFDAAGRWFVGDIFGFSICELCAPSECSVDGSANTRRYRVLVMSPSPQHDDTQTYGHQRRKQNTYNEQNAITIEQSSLHTNTQFIMRHYLGAALSIVAVLLSVCLFVHPYLQFSRNRKTV